jgi:predicted branched-subunit amino acid permease
MSLARALALWRHPEFARGAREMASVSPGIAVWGLLTGVAMAKSGLALPLCLLMQLIVFAGSAQLAALPLLVSAAPLWVVWATALCVNLRFIVFSAGWRPYFAHLPFWRRVHLGYFTADLNYVLFMRRFPEPRPSPEQLPYFWGNMVTNWFVWQIPALAGIFLADRIPAAWGLGFAGTLALLALTFSLVADRAALIAAAVAGAAAVAAYALPLRLNILVAIAAAVLAGLLIDHTSARRAMPEDDYT